jgi:hypothetical protein
MAGIRATELPDTDDEAAPQRPRSLWASTAFVLSVALVVILIGCAVWLATTRPDPAGPARPDHPARAEAVHGCGPAANLDAPPPAAAPVTSWKLLGHMAAPSSPVTGPADTTDGLPVCYSPDAAGALFAAANFIATTSSAAQREAALQHLAAPGPGQDAALANLRSSGPGPDSLGTQLAGFTFIAYGSRSATVDLALAANGGYAHTVLQLTWTGKDWQIVLPIGGYAVSPLPDLAGYILWQGA